MPFRLRKDAETWFKHVGKDKGLKGFDTNFDIYYLCLMAGLACRLKNPDIHSKDTSDLVDEFPKDYREKSKMIIALFLRTELRDLGTKLEDKKTLHSDISKLIDPESATRLSEDGLKYLNQYAHAGFDEIKKEFEPPHFLESFLPEFHAFINRKLDETRAL